ncbi:MAG: sensor histidine kinase N-terminal domain-containing protein [Alphaproteobacteria bacterium]|nr:sensor histidine kinase N-terminal domain-containing protein [Alphaproteobacteria bacterium]
MNKQTSLRRAFFRIVSVPLVICSLLIWSAGMAYIYTEVDEVYDATLAQYAREIDHLTKQGIFSVDENLGDDPAAKPQHKYERKIMFRIFENGKMVARSSFIDGLENAPLAPGYYDRKIDGKRWRIFVLASSETGHIVEVGNRYGIRYEMMRQLILCLLVPAILFLVAAMYLVWWGAARSLKQLVAISSQVDTRDVNDMTPIVDATIPQEVQPLLSALNRLFARVSDSFRREKEFTDNAAHELRTPLAAIKTQAQVIEKSETFTVEGQAGFANLLGAIDRAASMVDSLLAFSRVQSDKSEHAPVDLSALVKRETDELMRFTSWQGRRLATDIAPANIVSGSAQGLSILVRNIIVNALKFTPDNGEVKVSLSSDPRGTVLRVTDTGPGISDTMKDKVFERFFKGQKSVSSGSGLGLAIVKSIADMHGAEIALSDNQPTGLVFEVRFKS